MAYKYTLEEAYKLKDSICWNGMFYELYGLSPLALSFADVRVGASEVSCNVGFDVLLKEWMDPSEALSASTSTGDNGASDDQNCSADKVNVKGAQFRKALMRLNEALTENNIESLKKIGNKKGLSEDQITAGIGIHLVKKLTASQLPGEGPTDVEDAPAPAHLSMPDDDDDDLNSQGVTTVRRCKTQCPCSDTCNEMLDASRTMYIGSEHTLHGELDLMSVGVGLTVAERLADVTVDTEGPKESETEEEEETAELEETMVKEAAALQRQSSVIAQTIIFAWTQYNRNKDLHLDLSPYIPTVFIDGEKFVVYVYNPVSDSLLIYNYPPAFIWDKVEPLNEKYSGIFILWLILNYRLFFRTDIDIIEPSCKFKQQVRIDCYEELKEYRTFIRTHIPGVQFGRTTVGIKQLKKKKGKEQDGDTKRRKLCS